MPIPFTTTHNVLHCYVNGWLSHSAASSALKAIGYTPGAAEQMLQAAWVRAS